VTLNDFDPVLDLAAEENKNHSFKYQVKGKDSKTGLTDTTWIQQNVTHSDNK